MAKEKVAKKCAIEVYAERIPNRIFLRETTRLVNEWYLKPSKLCHNHEYIRMDAFIEKATSYIQQHWIWNTKMIEDFKKYMEGE